ncbi:bZIP transcription factor domain-containing protein [Purpureocillium lavendulum]|uniref:BZIP transcription factor domain-containing protein n=1 Tax=Purpureocillium lavendulum TaxID=1247861 RepID=A0AB34FFL6_9HYPO|nr:bZIP transcription factor domain-containing protein [Purpureocillium lavendulum]
MNSTLAPVQQPVPHDGDRTVAPNQLVDIWCGTDFNNSYYTMQNHLDPKSTAEALSSSNYQSLAEVHGLSRRLQPDCVNEVSAEPTPKKTRSAEKTRPHAASSADVMHFDDPKTMRVRRKNRIAADKCRSRRRLEEDALKSKHECLEKEYRGLSHAAVDLVAEIQVLKNMLLEHGNCDCHLIQDYLKEAASAWVTKKTHVRSLQRGSWELIPYKIFLITEWVYKAFAQPLSGELDVVSVYRDCLDWY